ncbi:hypothetical protein PENANT_c007G00518 [Penicillium antarcticum]|uniref:Uncharacterized protein n=1 Tax=Penicillium antarcticum TaxID=416450 RepID=A0A1V6QBS2_9EURO|nr:hypothetical protein PENANT_c007G00518 [Penicillium antarcticum]
MTIPKCDTVNSPSYHPQSNSGSPGRPKQLNGRSQTFPQSSVGNFEPNLPAYEGYIYSQADPVSGQSATWTRVERTEMNLSQHELFELVQKRGSKKPAAQQYQNLSCNAKRAHIIQLIDEQRRRNPHVEWSCVYAKEISQPSEAPHARYGEYATVTMNVILLKMPKNQMHIRTKTGGSVTRHSDPGVDTSHRARKQQQCIAPNQSRTIDNALDSPAPSPADSSEMSFEHSSGWSSDGSSDPNADSMLFERYDETSDTDDSESTYNAHQEVRPMQQPEIPRLGSPRGHEPSHTRANSNSRSGDRRRERVIPLRSKFEVLAAKTIGPKRFDRARSSGSMSGRRYKMQLINDNEIRSQLLDNREASIGHREKRLKRSYYEALEPAQRQSG